MTHDFERSIWAHQNGCPIDDEGTCTPHPQTKVISKWELLNCAGVCVYIMGLLPAVRALHGTHQGLLRGLQPHF